MDGLGDYDRSGGFEDGAVDLKHETRAMTMDRGRSFTLDAMDVDETNFQATAANVMGEFQRIKVVPEIDAYRYSKISQYAIENDVVTDGYIPDEKTIFGQLLDDAFKIYDEVGEEVELVVSMAAPVHKILIESDKIAKKLDVGSFTRGEIKFDFRKLDNLYIRLVPSTRMMTEYQFLTGKPGLQARGGFRPTATARKINYIICARNLPLAISKQDKIRIFTPDINQQKDAYKLDYRRYHDLWVLPQQMNKLRVNLRPA